MPNTRITFDNYEEFIGRRVRFCFGAYYPEYYGTITGYDVLPKSKWFGPDIFLIGEYVDGDGEKHTQRITMITDVGIGVHLLKENEYDLV